MLTSHARALVMLAASWRRKKSLARPVRNAMSTARQTTSKPTNAELDDHRGAAATPRHRPR